jgi:archaellum component FlaG (FlaF/FlaG flagellin family)
MDKTITTALMIIISMVMALALYNAAYPAIVNGGDSINSMASRASDEMKSQIKLIHAAGELDGSGNWQDANGDGDFDAFIWVKNVGSTTLTAIESGDVFFGPEGNFVRIPYQGSAGGASPYWSWQLENGSAWTTTATIKITIHYRLPLTAGRYFAKVTLANGTADETFLEL